MRRLILILFLTVFVGFTSLMAQTKTITGTVTSSEDGNSVPGVSIVVKGTTVGTITDGSGKYSLSVPSDATHLLYSFIGMVTQEVAIGGQSVINITMESESLDLNEVVVTALGIRKSKKALGYAVSEVNTSDMERVPVIDVTEGLKGKMAGVDISSASGSPGASTNIFIRGVSSLTQSNQPLYVIDGVPMNNFSSSTTTSTASVDFGNAASDINPNDIESMSVLKGAAATSLYGSRAANGAIIITTKSGAKGAPVQVNFSSSTSLEEVGRLPYYQGVYGQGWSGTYDSRENGSWGPKMDGTMRLTGNVVDNSQRLKPFKFYENGLRDFYEYGYTAQNSLSVSGSTDLMGYYVSFANTTQDGVIPGDKDKLNRNSITFKGNGGTEKTKIDFGVTYTGKKINAVSTGQGDDAGTGKSMFQEILQNPVDMYIPMFRDYKGKFDNVDNYYTPYAQNPYFIIGENNNERKSDRINSFLNINQYLAEGLNLMWRGGLDIVSSHSKRYGALTRISSDAPNFGTAQDVAGAVIDESRTVSQFNSDLLFIYDTKIIVGGGALGIKGTFGNNINMIQQNRMKTTAKGLVIDGYYNVKNIAGAPVVLGTSYEKRVIGLYGTIDFDLNSYLFVQLTARNDWSSTLPLNNNSFFYPGVNMGFVFTDLLPDNNILSYGKLRTSYAYAGNDAPVESIGTYYRSSVIRAGGYGFTRYPVNGIAAFEKATIMGNPNLSPEISKEFEIGFDLRFFSNRLAVDLSYYNKITDDLIMEATTAPSSGFNTLTSNLGQIENSGIELMLNGSVVKKDNFNWNITYIFTKSNTVLNSLSAELGVNEYIINSAYQTEFVAIPGEQLGQFRIPDYKRDPDGHIIVGSDNGFPLEGDKRMMGSIVPDYKMSLGNTLSYKDLSLSFLIDYQKGGQMYSYTSSITFWSGNNEQSLTNLRRPYVIPNSVIEVEDGVDGDGKPIYKYLENSTPVNNNWHEYYSGNTNRPIEEKRIIEKTYLKLRDVSLSYNLPSAVVNKIGLSSSSISIYGRNLFLWTPAGNSFVDPETSTYGNDLYGMFGEFAGAPSTRSYGVKLNVTF